MLNSTTAPSFSDNVYHGLFYVHNYVPAISLLCVLVILYRIAGRSKSIYELIPGPPSSSTLAGNMLEMSTTGAGTLPLEWHKKYHGNTVVRIHGPYFAGDGLLISDPTALWKIYDANASFIRPPVQLALGEKLVGKGIFLAEGNTHYRMKRVMQPAFNAGNVNNLVPHFRNGAVALVEAWEELLDVQGKSGPVSIDVFDWLGCSALDMIGLAAFGVKLGAVLRRRGIESTDSISDLATAYESVLIAMGAEETAASIFIRYSPPWIINMLMHFPHKLVKAVKHSMVSATNAAEVMIKDRMEQIQNGEPLTDDALTLIIKANLDEDAKLRLTESEMTAQITTILFAGHGSSAAFMSWCLYQLALRPDQQNRLREEILANAQRYDAEQDASIFTPKNMPFFDMFIKEIMRFYPVVHFNEKMAAADTTLKLSRPLVLKDGTSVTELPCPKGTFIYADILSYNFSTDIFGSDADQFRPERWENPITAKTAPSVYAGLFNFIAGPRACLGWRFVILEAQVLLFDLVRKFEFRSDGYVSKRNQMVMVPAVNKDGKQVLGMPLFVERV